MRGERETRIERDAERERETALLAAGRERERVISLSDPFQVFAAHA
jgi:hypothetical protein